MTTTSFSSLSLAPQIIQALEGEGYTAPTPIQQAAIPAVLTNADVIATAQTGTGKTAAFVLPILQQLIERAPAAGIRVLILSPTRELTLQIADSVHRYSKHLRVSIASVIGGVSLENQVRVLRQPPTILVATPGRLVDLVQRGAVSLKHVETFVLDEADRMLDMGFIRDVKRIVGMLPKQRQSLFFSATMPDEVVSLASSILNNPTTVSVARPATVNSGIVQKVYFVKSDDKLPLLTELMDREGIARALIFTRTKHRANRLSDKLNKLGIASQAIHSNKSQGARQRALAAFDTGSVRTLVATDIMARGIDVDAISHVINFEIPNDPESYVHRIGRTARAGASGVAYSFCSADELPLLAAIEKITKTPIAAETTQSFHQGGVEQQRNSRLQQASTQQRQHNGQGKSGPRRRRRRSGGSSAAAPMAKQPMGRPNSNQQRRRVGV